MGLVVMYDKRADEFSIVFEDEVKMQFDRNQLAGGLTLHAGQEIKRRKEWAREREKEREREDGSDCSSDEGNLLDGIGDHGGLDQLFETIGSVVAHGFQIDEREPCPRCI